ncbi:MAG: hypothetical protein WBP59_05025 [Ilumatobacteraceae bacterium]
MIPNAQADELRRRSHHLREVASTIERLGALRLELHAGDDTWRGRRPLLCRSVLAANQQQLHAAVDHLRWTAITFEHRADELDAVARSTTGLAG